MVSRQERIILGLRHIKVTLQDHSPLHEDCRKVSQVLARVGDKWSVLVVMLLRDSPRRFNEIKRIVDGISQQMLTRFNMVARLDKQLRYRWRQ